MRTDANFWSTSNSTPAIDFEVQNRSKKAKSNRGLGNLLDRLLSKAAGSNEPTITQKRDRKGNLIWLVYDPMTRDSASFSSEAEVRAWLDQRYYQ